MSFRSKIVQLLDEKMPGLIGAARYRLHVNLRGNVVFPLVTKPIFDRMQSKNASAIDVGANVGIFTHYLAAHFDTVIAVEPVPYLADRLRRSIPSNCTVAETALGDTEGQLTLRIPVDAQGNEMPALSTASSENSLAFIQNAGCVERHVPVARLDSLAKDIANLAFLKIDVEGFEGAVLAGATDILAQQRPVIQLEIGRAHNPNYRDILTQLNAAEFEVYALQKDGLYPDAERFILEQPVTVSNEDAASPKGCWDYLFVPRERNAELTAGLVRA